MHGCILVVDDESQWREELVEILTYAGYTARAVATAKEALDILDQGIYHLLILDIRLEGNESNTDGMALLRSVKERSLDEAIKIIMLSAHGTKEQMRTAFRDFGVADFLSKEDFNRQHFLENVRTAFEERVGINMALDIFWADDGGAEQAVRSLHIDNEQVKQNKTLCKRAATELEELLRRLFPKAESLIVRQLTSTPSRSGTCVLSVQPFYPTGGGQVVVVKFGHFPRIKEEEQHFKDHVRSFVSGARHTTIQKNARTPLLGGIVYSLLGTTNDNWIDFGQFYQENNIQKITSALDRLFHETCGSWYANPGRWLPRNLSRDYCRQFRSSIEQLESSIKDRLSSVKIKNGQLSFPLLTGKRLFTNPFQVIKRRAFIYPTYESITHGDLNQNNILVDQAEGMWLVDFESTERSHILRDVATLDAVVRFQLLKREEATLGECLMMEEALLSITHFSQLNRLSSAFQTENQALMKAYQTTRHLRMLARWIIDNNPSDSMEEYYVALLYNALFTLQFFSLSSRQREYALLSASLLAEKLTKK